MTPTLKFIPGSLRVKGAGVYKSADMTLEYVAPAPPSDSLRAPEAAADVLDRSFGIDAPGDLLLIADTLTLTFSGLEHRLAGLDAYTNRQRWKVLESGAPPEIVEQGMLLLEPASLEDDRYSMQAAPRYETTSDARWVRIVLNDERADAYYEVASGLAVGLQGGNITDIYLFDVTFTE